VVIRIYRIVLDDSLHLYAYAALRPYHLGRCARLHWMFKQPCCIPTSIMAVSSYSSIHTIRRTGLDPTQPARSRTLERRFEFKCCFCFCSALQRSAAQPRISLCWYRRNSEIKPCSVLRPPPTIQPCCDQSDKLLAAIKPHSKSEKTISPPTKPCFFFRISTVSHCQSLTGMSIGRATA
jgi:hypothetical protein